MPLSQRFMGRRPRLERLDAAPDARPGVQPVSALRVGAQAAGAVAVGALALGAVALGALAIGSLAIGRSRIHRLQIDELVVGGLTARDVQITGTLRAPNS